MKQAEKLVEKAEKKDSERKGKKELLRRHLEREKQEDKKGKKELLRRHLDIVKQHQEEGRQVEVDTVEQGNPGHAELTSRTDDPSLYRSVQRKL